MSGGRGVRAGMTAEDDKESWAVLGEHRLERTGLHVKLDKGFKAGTYCVYVEFDELAARQGFTAARRAASAYCAALKDQLARAEGYALGDIEDGSLSGDARRRRDLEGTFLSFTVTVADGRFHDDATVEQFRVAFLRAGQAWDQAQARVQTDRLHTRQERFRGQLAQLLDGDEYAGVDAATKERLLEEVPALAFARKGIGL
jgi:hypothetical protein